MKLILENWRKFIKKEKSADIKNKNLLREFRDERAVAETAAKVVKQILQQGGRSGVKQALVRAGVGGLGLSWAGPIGIGTGILLGLLWPSTAHAPTINPLDVARETKRLHPNFSEDEIINIMKSSAERLGDVVDFPKTDRDQEETTQETPDSDDPCVEARRRILRMAEAETRGEFLRKIQQEIEKHDCPWDMYGMLLTRLGDLNKGFASVGTERVLYDNGTIPAFDVMLQKEQERIDFHSERLPDAIRRCNEKRQRVDGDFTELEVDNQLIQEYRRKVMCRILKLVKQRNLLSFLVWKSGPGAFAETDSAIKKCIPIKTLIDKMYNELNCDKAYDYDEPPPREVKDITPVEPTIIPFPKK